MGCCENTGCLIFQDDFIRTSLETLTYSSETATTDGWVVTMTASATSCQAGDTISGESQLDYEKYYYYVDEVDGDEVTVLFLYGPSQSDSSHYAPSWQGITTFAVRRLGTSYATPTAAGSSANYMWGVTDDGLTGRSSHKLEVTAMAGNENFIFVGEWEKDTDNYQTELLTNFNSTTDEANRCVFRDSDCTDCYYTPESRADGYQSFIDSDFITTSNLLSPTTNESSFGIEGSINLRGQLAVGDQLTWRICQKVWPGDSTRVNIIASAGGSENKPDQVIGTTAYGSGYTYAGDKVALNVSDGKAIKSISFRYNDAESGKETCDSCVETQCDEQTAEMMFVDTKNRTDVEKDVQIGSQAGFCGTTTASSVTGNITYSATGSCLASSGTATVKPYRGSSTTTTISDSGSGFGQSSRPTGDTSDTNTDTFGLYSEIDVTVSEGVVVTHGYQIKCGDADGDGCYIKFSDTGSEVTDPNHLVKDGHSYTMGYCVMPYLYKSTTDPEGIYWRTVAYIKSITEGWQV